MLSINLHIIHRGCAPWASGQWMLPILGINQRVLIITLRQPPYAIGAGISKSI